MFIRANSDDLNRIKETKDKFFEILASLKKEAIGTTEMGQTHEINKTHPSIESELQSERDVGGAAARRKRPANNVDPNVDPTSLAESVSNLPRPNQGIPATQSRPSEGAESSSDKMPARDGNQVGAKDGIANGVAGPSPAGLGTGDASAYVSEKSLGEDRATIEKFLSRRKPPKRPGAGGAIWEANKRQESIQNGIMPPPSVGKGGKGGGMVSRRNNKKGR